MNSELAFTRSIEGSVLPALVAVAVDRAAVRVPEFFTVNIRDQHAGRVSLSVREEAAMTET